MVAELHSCGELNDADVAELAERGARRARSSWREREEKQRKNKSRPVCARAWVKKDKGSRRAQLVVVRLVFVVRPLRLVRGVGRRRRRLGPRLGVLLLRRLHGSLDRRRRGERLGLGRVAAAALLFLLRDYRRAPREPTRRPNQKRTHRRRSCARAPITDHLLATERAARAELTHPNASQAPSRFATRGAGLLLELRTRRSVAARSAAATLRRVSTDTVEVLRS